MYGSGDTLVWRAARGSKVFYGARLVGLADAAQWLIRNTKLAKRCDRMEWPSERIGCIKRRPWVGDTDKVVAGEREGGALYGEGGVDMNMACVRLMV